MCYKHQAGSLYIVKQLPFRTTKIEGEIGRVTQIYCRKGCTYSSLYRRTTDQADGTARGSTRAGNDDERV